MEGTCEFTTVTDSWKIFRYQICSIYAIVSKKDIQNANSEHVSIQKEILLTSVKKYTILTPQPIT